MHCLQGAESSRSKSVMPGHISWLGSLPLSPGTPLLLSDFEYQLEHQVQLCSNQNNHHHHHHYNNHNHSCDNNNKIQTNKLETNLSKFKKRFCFSRNQQIIKVQNQFDIDVSELLQRIVFCNNIIIDSFFFSNTTRISWRTVQGECTYSLRPYEALLEYSDIFRIHFGAIFSSIVSLLTLHIASLVDNGVISFVQIQLICLFLYIESSFSNLVNHVKQSCLFGCKLKSVLSLPGLVFTI